MSRWIEQRNRDCIQCLSLFRSFLFSSFFESTLLPNQILWIFKQNRFINFWWKMMFHPQYSRSVCPTRVFAMRIFQALTLDRTGKTFPRKCIKYLSEYFTGYFSQEQSFSLLLFLTFFFTLNFCRNFLLIRTRKLCSGTNDKLIIGLTKFSLPGKRKLFAL